jgi:hypothetical protein
MSANVLYGLGASVGYLAAGLAVARAAYPRARAVYERRNHTDAELDVFLVAIWLLWPIALVVLLVRLALEKVIKGGQ